MVLLERARSVDALPVPRRTISCETYAAGEASRGDGPASAGPDTGPGAQVASPRVLPLYVRVALVTKGGCARVVRNSRPGSQPCPPSERSERATSADVKPRCQHRSLPDTHSCADAQPCSTQLQRPVMSDGLPVLAGGSAVADAGPGKSGHPSRTDNNNSPPAHPGDSAAVASPMATGGAWIDRETLLQYRDTLVVQVRAQRTRRSFARCHFPGSSSVAKQDPRRPGPATWHRDARRVLTQSPTAQGSSLESTQVQALVEHALAAHDRSRCQQLEVSSADCDISPTSVQEPPRMCEGSILATLRAPP